MLDGFLRDVAYAWRALLHRRGFLIGAVATLALGVGTNTAMFGVVNAGAAGTAAVRAARQARRVQFFRSRESNRSANPCPWRITRTSHRSSHHSRRWRPTPIVTLRSAAKGEPEQVRGVWGTGGLLQTLGVTPVLGRTFVAADDAAGGDNQVVLSYELWQRRYRGAADVLGQTIMLNGRSNPIIGVMPRGFQFPLREATGLSGPAMLWIRHPSDAPTRRGPLLPARRGAARAERAARSRRERSFRPWPPVWQPRIPRPMRIGRFTALPLKDAFVGSSRLTLYAFFVATGLVLLIAAANVSNLLLSRGAARRRELAIRVAQGAGPRHLLRQLLAEGALLAALGAVSGVLLAAAALKVLVAIAPADVPRLEYASIDGTVLRVQRRGGGLLCDRLRPSARAARNAPWMRTTRCARAWPALRRPEAGRVRRVLVGAEVALSFRRAGRDRLADWQLEPACNASSPASCSRSRC
jgi:hypothetical protein